MIRTITNQEVETFAALNAIVEALDKRFPDGNSVFQRVSRLAEECGELAAARFMLKSVKLVQSVHPHDPA